MAIKTFVQRTSLSSSDINTYCYNNGLKFLDWQSVNGTANFVRSDVFTTEFDSYRIIVDNFKPTTNGDPLYLRMRTSGGTYSGNTYSHALHGITFSSFSVTNGGASNINVFYVTVGSSAGTVGATIELNNVRSSGKPTASWITVNANNGNNNVGSGIVNNTADYTGIELSTYNSVMTCNMTIYGYRKA